MVTLKADDRGRVKLPGIKPGDVFAFEDSGHGVRTLTELQPVKRNKKSPKFIRFEKRNGYTVAVVEGSIDMESLNRELKEFP